MPENEISNTLEKPKKFLTPFVVADRLGIKPDKVRRDFRYWPGVIWLGSGGDDDHQARRVLRIPEDAVEEYIRQHSVTATGETPLRHRRSSRREKRTVRRHA